MPSPSPHPELAATEQLQGLAQSIRERRLRLRISSTALAEAAGMSRVTIHRIEHGEPSVTIGAYLNAMAALGLKLGLSTPSPGRAKAHQIDAPLASAELPAAIKLTDFPQLKQLAWHLPNSITVTPQQAFELYERNWRHIDRTQLSAHETALIEQLVRVLGKGHLLV